MAEPSRLIVGISGASGLIYGMRLLRAQRKIPVESHLVMTRTAALPRRTKLVEGAEVRRLADATYATIAAGALD
jgi:flavin prenyltransferase